MSEWKLVPTVATNEMLLAMGAKFEEWRDMRETYAVMIAAAPVPPAASAGLVEAVRAWKDATTVDPTSPPVSMPVMKASMCLAARDMIEALRAHDAAAEQPAHDEPLTLANAPFGTEAPAHGGGCWTRTAGGWQWGSGGGVFPRPGGDWNGKLIAPRAEQPAPVDELPESVECYRTSMSVDVLRSWAADAQKELERLRAAVAADRAGDDVPCAYMEVDGDEVFFHLGRTPSHEYSHLLTPLYVRPSTAKPSAEMVTVAEYHRAIEVMCNAQEAISNALGLSEEDGCDPANILEAIEALQFTVRRLFDERAALDKLATVKDSLTVDQENTAFNEWMQTLDGYPFAGVYATLMRKAWQARAALKGGQS
jgi:hypothetical protein